jgi:hypothetical protein
MTLCVGALAGPFYICVSDMKLSMIAPSAVQETRYWKTGPVAQNWALSFSGVASNYRFFMTNLASDVGRPYKRAEIMTEVQRAYDDERNRKLTDALKRYNISLADFVAHGRKSFGDQMFFQIQQELDDAWSLTCLLGGVVEEPGYPDQGHLLTLDASGWTEHSIPGFAAIGIGDRTAITILYRTLHAKANDDIRSVTARLLEAKFVAEVSPYIGTETSVALVQKHQFTELISTDEVNAIRNLWNRQANTFIEEARALMPQVLDLL